MTSARFCFKGLSHEHSRLFVQTAWRMQLQVTGAFRGEDEVTSLDLHDAAQTTGATTLPVVKDLTARMDPLETYMTGCILGGFAVNVTGTLENMQDGIESMTRMLHHCDGLDGLGVFVMRVVLGEMQAFVDACRDAQVG